MRVKRAAHSKGPPSRSCHQINTLRVLLSHRGCRSASCCPHGASAPHPPAALEVSPAPAFGCPQPHACPPSSPAPLWGPGCSPQPTRPLPGARPGRSPPLWARCGTCGTNGSCSEALSRCQGWSDPGARLMFGSFTPFVATEGNCHESQRTVKGPCSGSNMRHLGVPGVRNTKLRGSQGFSPHCIWVCVWGGGRGGKLSFWGYGAWCQELPHRESYFEVSDTWESQTLS